MLYLSTFLRSGGKLKFQDFTSSGTFSPSSALLALGGTVHVLLVGGGGGGGACYVSSGLSYGAGGGGGGGQVLFSPATVTGDTSVTIGSGGAGGAGSIVDFNSMGTAGGSSIFSSPVSLTAIGGGPGQGSGYTQYSTDGASSGGQGAVSMSYILCSGGGGGGAGGNGGSATPLYHNGSTEYTVPQRQTYTGQFGGSGGLALIGTTVTANGGTGGIGLYGYGGGGGGASGYYPGGGASGGGKGGSALVLAGAGSAGRVNSGGGGGGSTLLASGGTGGSGFCRVFWVE